MTRAICATDRSPVAGLVELADDARSNVLAPVVEVLFQLVLDDLALFLDDQHFVQASRELAHRVGLERPGHADLEEADADRRSLVLADAKLLERLEHVTVGLARCHDAQARLRRIDGHTVQAVGARVGDRGVDLGVLHQRFLLARLHAQRVGRQPRMHAAGRESDVRSDGPHLLDVGRHRSR
jgi:hypothetical protein